MVRIDGTAVEIGDLDRVGAVGEIDHRNPALIPGLDEDIAARHRHELPAALRMFLRGPGATKTSGAGVLSYLLFEAGYCRELIELGRRDAMAKREALCQFLRVPCSS